MELELFNLKKCYFPKFQFSEFPCLIVKLQIPNFKFSNLQFSNFKNSNIWKYNIEKLRYKNLPAISKIKIIRYEHNIFKYVPNSFLYLLKYFGDEYGLRGSRFSYIFGRSKNVRKVIGIDQEPLISHFGIIKTPTQLLWKTKKNKTNYLFCRICVWLLDCMCLFGKLCCRNIEENYERAAGASLG